MTQILADGTNTYLYGLVRIAERAGGVNEFYLGDALGSVRQLTNSYSEVLLTKSYDPFGNNLQSLGTGETVYGFTGETTDANGLIYLRARYYHMALKYAYRRFFLTRKISPFGNRFLACNLYVVSRVRSKTAV